MVNEKRDFGTETTEYAGIGPVSSHVALLYGNCSLGVWSGQDVNTRSDHGVPIRPLAVFPSEAPLMWEYWILLEVSGTLF